MVLKNLPGEAGLLSRPDQRAKRTDVLEGQVGATFSHVSRFLAWIP